MILRSPDVLTLSITCLMKGEVPEYIQNHPMLLPHFGCLPPVEIQRKSGFSEETKCQIL